MQVGKKIKNKNHLYKYIYIGDFFMRKKILCIILSISIIMLNINYIYADDENEIITTEDYIEASCDITDELTIQSNIAVVYDRTSRKYNMGKK